VAAVLKKAYLGIDIGADAISAVLCQVQRGEERIVAARRIERASESAEADTLAALLEPLLAHDGAMTAACALALPAAEFVFRPLAAPFQEDRKLRQVLPLELEPSLVAPAEEMVFDYRRLNNATPPRIFAAAIEKTRVSEILGILHRLRLDPEWVTAGGICPALCLLEEPSATGPYAVVALRPHGATVVPVADGHILALRDLPISLENESGHRPLAALLKQTFQALTAGDGASLYPRRLLLTGYGDYSEAFEALLPEELGIAVERIDLSRRSDSMAKGANDWVPGAMNGALALALRARRGETGFNLRQGDFAVKKFWTRYKRQLRSSANLAAVVLLLGGAQMVHGIYLKQRRVEGITEETIALFRAARPEATRVVDPVSQMRAAITELETATRIPGSEAARPRAIDILAALSREIPAELDVEITRMVIGTDNLTLTGHTAAFNAVDDIKTRLEKIPMFQEVTIAAANIDNRSNRVRFTINIGRLEVVPWPSN
jgi:general secretion pathway protein L